MPPPTAPDPLLAMSQALTPKRAVSYIRVSTREQAERGGAEEGFSIPAQRDANKRKAASMGALVVKEFVDRGESARSANRPELQRMLAYLRRTPDVDYVIVHKLDRLARNRADDVEINRVFEEAGVRLISTSENIDQTPGGILLHGIMSSIAEFYSRNLANEVI
ncbi:recombinase family protein, partial [Actinomyces oricola]|uniref:recombinase family protein n=1 Tax=Actinomyces oricola TaxID=206043 RepID=UPI0019D4B4C3